MNPYIDTTVHDRWWEVVPDRYVKHDDFVMATEGYVSGELTAYSKDSLNALGIELTVLNDSVTSLRDFHSREHGSSVTAWEVRPFHVIYDYATRGEAISVARQNGPDYGVRMTDAFLKEFSCINSVRADLDALPNMPVPEAEAGDRPEEATATRYMVAADRRRTREVHFYEFEPDRWFSGDTYAEAREKYVHYRHRATMGLPLDTIHSRFPVTVIEPRPWTGEMHQNALDALRATGEQAQQTEDKDARHELGLALRDSLRRTIERKNRAATSVAEVGPMSARTKGTVTWFEFEQDRWFTAPTEDAAKELYFEKRADRSFGRTAADIGFPSDADDYSDVPGADRARQEQINKTAESIEAVKPLKARAGIGHKTWYEYEDDRWFAPDQGGGERGARTIYFEHREDRSEWGRKGRHLELVEPVSAPETPAEAPQPSNPLGGRFRWFKDRDDDLYALMPDGVHLSNEDDIDDEDSMKIDWDDNASDGDFDNYDTIADVLRRWGPLREVLTRDEDDADDDEMGLPLSTVEEVLRGIPDQVGVAEEATPVYPVLYTEDPPKKTEPEPAPLTFETVERGQAKTRVFARKVIDGDGDPWFEFRYNRFSMGRTMTDVIAETANAQAHTGKSLGQIKNDHRVEKVEDTLYPLDGPTENEQFVHERMSRLIQPGDCRCESTAPSFHFEDTEYCSTCGKRR